MGGRSLASTLPQVLRLQAPYSACTAATPLQQQRFAVRSSTAFDTTSLKGARCIELGAGATGLPSLIAAQLGCFSQV